jgi:hypothetical protein
MKRSKHPETKTESLNLVFFLMKYYKIFIRKKKRKKKLSVRPNIWVERIGINPIPHSIRGQEMGGNEGFSPCVQSILQMEPKLRELRSQSLMSSLIYLDKTYRISWWGW